MTSTTASHFAATAEPLSRWARPGLFGFLFFLIKGLLWLIVPAVLWLGS
jgi:hypothetical protein